MSRLDQCDVSSRGPSFQQRVAALTVRLVAGLRKGVAGWRRRNSGKAVDAFQVVPAT